MSRLVVHKDILCVLCLLDNPLLFFLFDENFFLHEVMIVLYCDFKISKADVTHKY